FLSKLPTKVNGMHKTPSNKSLIAKLIRKILVTLLIRRLVTRVTTTNTFPTIATKNMREYKVILTTASTKSASDHRDVVPRFLGEVKLHGGKYTSDPFPSSPPDSILTLH